VRVRVKELTTEAFLLVPGHDVHSLDLAADRPSSPASERRPGTTDTPMVQNNFSDRVDASGATFGIGSFRWWPVGFTACRPVSRAAVVRGIREDRA
jgi:hypothetical protein